MRRFYRHYRPDGQKTDSGEDSFLDIISNMVGIMIILVMIAGVRVGNVVPDALPDDPSRPTSSPMASHQPAEPMDLVNLREEIRPASPEEMTENPVDVERIQKTRCVKTMRELERIHREGTDLKNEVDRLNEQMILVKQEADGAGVEYQGLVAQIAAVEAAMERAVREKGDEEKKRIELGAELRRLAEESQRLQAEADRLAQIRPKPTVLENMPTPLTKKVEGKEAVFSLREGKISHVPIGYFAERVRGYFRSMRDVTKSHFEETMGPTDGYLFRFEGSLHKIHEDDGRTAMTVVFDEGEFIPDGLVGETVDEALRPESEFRRKLALYLQDSSVITLSVYPDSFDLLRSVKKFLLENDFTIAIRPMPVGKNIVISPNGTESTTY